MASKNHVGSPDRNALERWRSTLFMVGGILLAILAMLWGMEVFLNMTVERAFFGQAGFAVAFLGLLGLYPALADRTPWLARAGAFFAVVGIVVNAVVALGWAVNLLGLIETLPAWVEQMAAPGLLTIMLGFLIFGVACLRTDVYPRSVGLLLLGPTIMFPVTLAAVIAWAEGDFPYVIHFIHNGAEALVLLGVGYILSKDGAPTVRGDQESDTTSG